MSTEEMRVLTVRQPWAWSIVYAAKDVENRSRNVAGGYRGAVAIHAGLTAVDYDDPVWDKHEYRDAFARETSVVRHRVDVRGGIIGVVDLVDVHLNHGDSGCGDTNQRTTFRAPACSPWGERNAQHLVLANPRPLALPIPFRGSLGLRKLDDDTVARVLAQVLA